jgi:hypothetical protein
LINRRFRAAWARRPAYSHGTIYRVVLAGVVDVTLGTVQAIATLGALYFAWRTVDDARNAELARRVDSMMDEVADFDRFARSMSLGFAQRHQVRLRALRASIDLDLPKTDELAHFPLTHADVLVSAYELSDSVIEELAAAAAIKRERPWWARARSRTSPWWASARSRTRSWWARARSRT